MKKNFFRTLGIIVLVTIIIFTMAGCDEPEEPLVESPTVTEVTVSSTAQSVVKGNTLQFNATVTGENDPAQTVTWSIVETNKHAQTTINSTGLLTVNAAESLTSLTVRATSTVDTTKSGTATVTISGGNGETPVTSWKGLTIPAQTKGVLHQSYQGKNDVLHISPNTAYEWAVLTYPLNSYAGQTVEIEVSMDVWLPAATKIVWQVNQQPGYPVIAGSTQTNVSAGSWQTVTGKASIAVASGNVLYLSGQQIGSASAYLADFSIKINGNGDNTPTVSTVTVTPSTASVAKGATQQFGATVSGENNPAQTVTWSIVQTNKHAQTTISSTGLLTVNAAETLTELTVRATSTVDTTKNGQATVTVTGGQITETLGDTTVVGGNLVFTLASFLAASNNAVTGSTRPLQAVSGSSTYIVSNGGINVTGRSAAYAGLDLYIDAANLNLDVVSNIYEVRVAGNVIGTPPANARMIAQQADTPYAWVASQTVTGADAAFSFSGSLPADYAQNRIRIVSNDGNTMSFRITSLIIENKGTRGSGTVFGVGVNPSNASVEKGETQQFTATVSGTGDFSQAVTWSIVQTDKHALTTISSTGLLTVNVEETLTLLTVRATSTANPAISGTATVTVTGDFYAVATSVSLEPDNVELLRGDSQQYTAEVSGYWTNGMSNEYDPVPQTVTWSFGEMNGGIVTSTGSATTTAGSSISNSGLLTLADNETFDTLLYVVASSTVTPSVTAYGTVTVKKDGLHLTVLGRYKDVIGRGGSAGFYVLDSNYQSIAPNDINWSIVETNKASGTYFEYHDTSVNLRVAADETLLTLTISAVLKSNPLMEERHSMRVVSVDKITLNTGNIVLPRGTPYTFTGTVHGENNPPQDILWFISPISDIPFDAGTTIDHQGVLNISPTERNRFLRIWATTYLNIEEIGALVTVLHYHPDAAVGRVIEITDDLYDEDGKYSVSLAGLSYNEVFLSIVNPTEYSRGDIGAIEIAAPSYSSSFSVRQAQRSRTSSVQSNTAILPFGSPPGVAEFNANPPPIPAHLKNQTRGSGPQVMRSLVPYNIGETKSFYINAPSSVEATATLMATGTHSNIWVVDGCIDQAFAESMAARFDIIYPAVTNVIGYEYGGGPDGNGGIDGDPKIQILFYDIPGNVAGYFYSGDFYGRNSAEIFYINGPGAMQNPDYYYSALAHEFQHMINFNQKMVKNDTASPTWYDEMLAMMIQDVTESMLGIDVNNRLSVWNVRFAYFFSKFSMNRLDIWRDGFGADTNMAYAEKYAFGAYLLRNYGGARLLQAILSNNTTGIPSLEAALQAVANVSFEEAFSRYGEAMIYSSRNMPAGANTYDRAVTDTIGSITYNIPALDIWFMYWNVIEDDLYADRRWPPTLNPYSLIFDVPPAYRGLEVTGTLPVTIIKPEDGVRLYLLIK